MPGFSFSEDDLNQPLDEVKEGESIPMTSVVSPGVELEGKLRAKYGIEVGGTFTGNLRSNSLLRVKDSGKIDGSVDAYNVSIEGKIQASLIARKRLEVLKGGTFIGSLDIQPERIVLSEHALFGKTEEAALRYREQYSRKSSEKTQKAEKPESDSPKPEMPISETLKSETPKNESEPSAVESAPKGSES